MTKDKREDQYEEWLVDKKNLDENLAQVSQVKDYFAGKQIEKDLADAFAIVSNKFWRVEDNVYDYKEGMPEYVEACAITDEWGALMDEYEERICEILVGEGVTIPETGRRSVLKPFMKRNGYIDASGWWVKDK